MSPSKHYPEAMRLTFLGHSCDASAAALAALLGEKSTEFGITNTSVGAMQASPAATGRPADPGNAVPTREEMGRIGSGDAGIASTDSDSRMLQDVPNQYIAGDHEIVSVILAGVPGAQPAELERLAAEANLPVVWVRSVKEVAAAMRAAASDVAVAACFPWRLPIAARAVPPLGILNIHPSLLPAGRGPEPVFWTLRRGEQATGVTVHRMEAGFDTGPIVTQTERSIPPGIRAPELENELMALGARLLLEALPALVEGSLQPRPQSSNGVSHAPVPSPADWTMSPLLPAAWAWRFARGVAPIGGPLAVIAGGALIPVSDALDWSPNERLPERVVAENDGTLRVRFSPGWVRFSH